MNWQVYSHGPLIEVIPGTIWYVQGSLPKGQIPRNMVIFRRNDDKLWIHSPIALKEEEQKKLDSLGDLDLLVVPNPFHRLDAPRYRMRYPKIKICCPKAARQKIAAKVAVDGDAEDLVAAWGIRCLMPDGIKPVELCYELPTAEGPVLVVTDILMNLSHFKGFEGWVFKKMGSTGFFGMTRLGSLIFLKDRKAFCHWLEERAKTPDLRGVMVSHGLPILQDPANALITAARRL